jgi:hypothetical protein
MDMLPSDLTVVGIDEKTALVIEPDDCTCRVIGAGGVTLIHGGQAHGRALTPERLDGSALGELARRRKSHVHPYQDGHVFALSRIGPFRDPLAGEGLPTEVWSRALEVRRKTRAPVEQEGPPPQVLTLLDERQAARQSKDWAAADRLRQQAVALGWFIQDTPEGQKAVKSE